MSLPLPLSLRVGTLRRRITVHALRITVMRSILLDRMLQAWKGQSASLWRVWKGRNTVAFHRFTDSYGGLWGGEAV
jgi:hypothetical protein